MTGSMITGHVVAGHGVASGRSTSSPYPAGTICLQMPFFQALGLDLSNCFSGTLNVSFAPAEVVLSQPDMTFPNVDWSEHHPPETFSFWRVEMVSASQQRAKAWIYRPHPETKQRHWQPPTVLEVLAPFQEGLSPGSEVSLNDPQQRLQLVDGVRLRARLLEFLKFRVLASQSSFFSDNNHVDRRVWLKQMHPEALQLPDQDLDRVWQQAQMLYTED
ncbi:MAG: hypothetical protein CMN91_03470 [Synechococcus sp. ARS1019]|nr:hypothetical protein [Synechococcus sp. ARS1019]